MTSLSRRRQALEHVIALANKLADDTVLEDAREGVRVLKWLEQREAAFREIARLEKEHPEMFDLLATFPGSTLTVRRREPL